MNIGKSHITQVHFNKLWEMIEHELTLLYKDSKCSGSVIYNNIYIICTSTSNKYVEDLYWKIGDFLYDILRVSKKQIYESEFWIREYTIVYKKYLDFVSSVNHIADYLNQFITTKSIYQFAFLLWERCILQSCAKYKGSNLGEHLIDHENLDEVSLCIQSFKQIVVEQEKPLLYYVERYEKYALSKVIDTLNQFLKTNSSADIHEYTVRLKNFTKQLREKRKKIFLKESWKKHDMIVEDLLVNQKKKWMKNEIFKIINQHVLPVEILNTIRNSMNESKKCEPTKIDEFDDGNAPQFKSSSISEIPLVGDFNFNTNISQSIKKFDAANLLINEKTPPLPLNDFYALFSDNIPSLYTYTTPALNTMKEISMNLSLIKQASEVLDSVLLKYLSAQLNAHNHLLDKKIETLYIFYTLFNHVVRVGFLNSKSANHTLTIKLKEVFNSLTPSLTTRLIDFSNIIVKGECVVEKKTIICRKGFIDFYEKNETLNLNEEEGIDYWGDEESDQEISIDQVSCNSVPIDVHQAVPFANPDDKIPSKEDFDVSDTKIYKQRRNKSLPDLSATHLRTGSYKDSALLRVFIHLYDLVDDKLDFFKKYLAEMAKRVLLHGANYYKELEIFNLLDCDDRDLALKGEVMFTDMLSMINDESGVYLLTESAWNLDYDTLNITLPIFFNDITTSVTKSRVKWAWEYSIVYIEINKKVFKLNFLQYLIIDLFNTHTKINRDLIRIRTQLHSFILENVIRSLTKARLVYINNDFLYLDTNCDTLNISDYYTKEDMSKLHEINKEMYYLCKISNIMKREKKMGKEELYMDICKCHTNKFDISDDEILKGIKGCLDKGIIEEKDEFYIYLP
ncbi:hypothetical protein P3W45_001042 [Vairimorpha bombi]|jgi:hypothetical protein